MAAEYRPSENAVEAWYQRLVSAATAGVSVGGTTAGIEVGGDPAQPATKTMNRINERSLIS